MYQERFDEGRLEIPRFRACYVDQMLSQKEGQLQAERSSDYKAVIRNMKNVEDSDYQTPETLRDVLREYQKFGFRWLNTLADLGFGGILADDMGLGKNAADHCLSAVSETAEKDGMSSSDYLPCFPGL